MSARSKVKRKDSTHKPIVEAVEKIGATVLDLSGIGGGCPDILVGYRGKNFLFELKSPGNQPKKNQEKWALAWKGDTYVAVNPDYVIEVLTGYRIRR